MSGDSAAGDRGCDEGQWADFDDSGKRVVPVLRVSTSLDALHSGLRRAGVTDSGENLSAAALRRLACDAEIIPTVLNGKGPRHRRGPAHPAGQRGAALRPHRP